MPPYPWGTASSSQGAASQCLGLCHLVWNQAGSGMKMPAATGEPNLGDHKGRKGATRNDFSMLGVYCCFLKRETTRPRGPWSGAALPIGLAHGKAERWRYTITATLVGEPLQAPLPYTDITHQLPCHSPWSPRSRTVPPAPTEFQPATTIGGLCCRYRVGGGYLPWLAWPNPVTDSFNKGSDKSRNCPR